MGLIFFTKKKGSSLKERHCLDCNKLFYTYNYLVKKGYGNYCSQKCYWKSLNGQHNSPKTEFKKGMTSWLKGKSIQTNTGKTHFNKGCIPWNKNKECPQFSGKNHWNWKGGITELPHLIRTSFRYINWRNSVYERDKYTCQKCDNNNRGNNINAHHYKIQFKYLLQNFLKEYDQFSPIEDKETLVRLAMKYKPFWDINNGKTLCEDCHNKTKMGVLT